MLMCAQHPYGLRVRALAGVACLFFAYETYCVLYKPPGTVFGVSEQCVRFFALSVFCPLFVWCAHQLLNGGNVFGAKVVLVARCVFFSVRE